MGAKSNSVDDNDSGISQCKLQKKSDDRNSGVPKSVGEEKSELKLGGCENKMTTLREVKTPITAQLNKGHNTGTAPCMQEILNAHYPEKWEKENTKTAEAEKPTKVSEENITPTSPIIENEENQLQNLEEDMEDYVDEQFDYEFEDLIVDEPLNMDEPLNPLPIFTNDEISPILISEDPPFSEKDLEDFINNEAINGDVDPAMPEGTFHSIHNSTRSSASVVAWMERLDVHHTNQSTSTSSKRKFFDGVEDTASSGTKEGKKNLLYKY